MGRRLRGHGDFHYCFAVVGGKIRAAEHVLTSGSGSLDDTQHLILDSLSDGLAVQPPGIELSQDVAVGMRVPPLFPAEYASCLPRSS